MSNYEVITFEIHLLSEYWDKPPHAQILLDGVEKFNQDLLAEKSVIKFTHKLQFGPHELKLIRSGKVPGQYVSPEQDQKLTIEKVIIDGVNIRNILWSYSKSIPEYPEPWASLQRKQGIELEKELIGETTFGHNTTWSLNFNSPFYRFIMKWMNS